ncbi:unnamed protein product [Durusdinium trenchii]|uniref:DNA-directed DNA polymerase n=1 Tax=Durusdinium trenchii TaxID=1381693 RepID=A0ABP0H568_9DINO
MAMPHERLMLLLRQLLLVNVLMMAVVLLAFTEGLQWDEIYDAAEIFAGKGVLSRCLLAGGYATASLDILHFTPWVYPVGFGIRFTRTMPLLQKEKSKPNTIAEDKVPTIDEIKPNDVLPCLDSMDDLWRDARMSDVLHYLYGGTGVQLPDDWTQFAMTIPLPLKQDPGNVESEAAVKTTTEEENAHDDDPSSEKKSRKLESALRRVCTPKRGSGKLEVSQDIYKKWLAGGSQRKALLDEAFKKHIEHMQRRSRKTKIHVDSGFYTKENMKKKLGWSATRIAKAVQYCTHPSRVKTHVRRDKYESNVKEYWVDVETTGSFDNEHEESLTDRTCVEGQAATFDLGIQPVMTLLRTKPVPKEKAASAKNKAAKAAAKASAEPRKRAKRDQEALEADSTKSKPKRARK